MPKAHHQHAHVDLVLLFIACLFALVPLTAHSSALFSDIDWSDYSGEPIEARVGVQIHQLTGIDQKKEQFGVVATVRMEWTDPNLAFVPEQGAPRSFRVYTGEGFRDYADANGLLAPGFLILNRQGRLDISDSTVAVFEDGSAIFVERFTATLQAPDFDFRTYPFDRQHFSLNLGFLLPLEVMQIVELEGFSGMGPKLGEEEWVVEETIVLVGDWQNPVGFSGAEFNLVFTTHRHLQYYLLRIFVPLVILLVVTYSAFLLKDFTRRIEICTTTLLTFVAFNFAISKDLPRLGYLTFMDIVMAMSFLMIGITVVWNVILRRAELNGRVGLVRRLDTYTLWIYPFAQIVLVYIAWLLSK